MIEAIRTALDQLEQEHEVRVLWAVESGSRAWGFASPDSDYDVRFLYVHRPEWYLSVFEARDVVEAQLPGDLDVSGWELRKALRLMAKTNMPLAEWLGSPIVYREVAAFRDDMRATLDASFSPATACFQYLGQARRILDADLAPDLVRLKRIFYFLRPLYAARWVVERRTMAPTPFAELLAAPWIPAEERAWVEEVQARKMAAGEAERAHLSPERRAWMREQLSLLAAAGPSLGGKSSSPAADLDGVLRRWVLGG